MSNRLSQLLNPSQPGKLNRSIFQRLHLDPPLLLGIVILTGLGLMVLYSADNSDWSLWLRQVIWAVISFLVLLVFAQIPPRKYYQWAPWVFALGIFLMCVVLVFGHSSKGAQRWLNVGLFKLQPSEILKISMPMVLAWYLDKKVLPPDLKTLLVCGILLVVPLGLAVKQPDLGTGLMIVFTGMCVLLLAGIRWRHVMVFLLSMAAAAPLIWHVLHDYQRQRLLTFLNP